jgi:DnaA-homolog protein
MKPLPRQLALDLAQPLRPTLDNFVVGRNAEAVAALRVAATGGGERFIYLWGQHGCGRTHLLRALQAAGAGLGPDEKGFPPEFDPACRLYLVDDVDRLDEARQQRLFVLQNEVRAARGAVLVAAGGAPPAQLALREDVRTRLGWGLVYQLQLLSDEDKHDALQAHAAARGLPLAPEITAYLLTHLPRDLRTQVSALEALDAHALALRRTLTLPLVREWLQSGQS